MKEKNVLKGSCLCGNVQYQYNGTLDEISICHCEQCRKAQGSAFVPVSPIHSSAFSILQGKEYLKEYRSSPNRIRAFCGECGSPLYSARDDQPDVKRLRLGILETPIEVENKYHIFVRSKASWFDITDGLPQFDGFKE
jgi:hypothetical protein